jgi:hypothetical protein
MLVVDWAEFALRGDDQTPTPLKPSSVKRKSSLI